MELLRQLIGPTHDASAGQLAFRALLLLLVGIVFVRIAGRRTFAQATPLDIVVALMVGSNLSRVMTGEIPVWPALAATLTLVVLHRALALASLRWAWVARWVQCEPTVLVKGGVRDTAAMRRHGISDADLSESLRLEQVGHLEDVDLATLEAGGRISVSPRKASK